MYPVSISRLRRIYWHHSHKTTTNRLGSRAHQRNLLNETKKSQIARECRVCVTWAPRRCTRRGWAARAARAARSCGCGRPAPSAARRTAPAPAPGSDGTCTTFTYCITQLRTVHCPRITLIKNSLIHYIITDSKISFISRLIREVIFI